MSRLVFPHLYGLAWEMTKHRLPSTLKQGAFTPGYSTRLQRGPDPIFSFDLEYKVLDDGLAHDSLNILEGWHNDRGGNFDSFLLKLSDVVSGAVSTITGQVITPDSGGCAPIVRAIGTSGSAENIYELAGVNGNPGTAPVLHMSGSVLNAGTDYTIQGPGYSGSGYSYPGLVAVISKTITGTVTADFTWYYRVLFAEDEMELQMFLYKLWTLKKVTLEVSRN
jgi:hypothetical protein